MTSPPAPRRRLLAAPERAASILGAAAAVFAEQGYTRTTVEQVAARAKVSKLIVYRHFNSKHELYRAILDQVRDRLAAVEHPAGGPDPADPRAAFAAAVATLRAEFAVARENPDGYRLLHRHAAHEPEFAAYVAELKAAGYARAEATLAGVADPLLRPWLARVVSGTVDGAFLDWLDAGDPARDDDMVRRVARLLGAMVGSILAAPDV
jgi:AcrR family transcriptional regulator